MNKLFEVNFLWRTRLVRKQLDLCFMTNFDLLLRKDYFECLPSALGNIFLSICSQCLAELGTP